MDGGLTFTFRPGAEKRRLAEERDKRAREMIEYAPKFATMGVPPDEINRMAKDYIENGSLNFPTEQTKLLPREPGVDVVQRSTRVPFEFKEPETTFVNLYSGQQFAVPGKKVKTYGVDPNSPAARRASMSTGAGKDINAMGTPDLRAYHSSLVRQLENEIPGTPEYQQIADNTNLVSDELNARLKRSSVQPKKAEVAPTTELTGNPGNPKVEAAKKWLQDRGAPITDANIQAVIKRGKV